MCTDCHPLPNSSQGEGISRGAPAALPPTSSTACVPSGLEPRLSDQTLVPSGCRWYCHSPAKLSMKQQVSSAVQGTPDAFKCSWEGKW